MFLLGINENMLLWLRTSFGSAEAAFDPVYLVTDGGNNFASHNGDKFITHHRVAFLETDAANTLTTEDSTVQLLAFS